VFGDTLTAANWTPLSDGAAVALLSTDAWAQERGIPVLAHLTYSETAAVDYVHGEEGLLMAPVHAVPRMLDRAGLSLQDFDLYEIHEAFAAQVLSTLKAWEEGSLGAIDRAKLNVAGGSLATGHPFAATGGRIFATVAKLLAERFPSPPARALISICAAGGQGVVAIVERA
jgi:acetyl-CoA C-acetyltransferase